MVNECVIVLKKATQLTKRKSKGLHYIISNLYSIGENNFNTPKLKAIVKKLVLLFSLFVLCHISNAQCDKKVTFKIDKVREIKDNNSGQEMPVASTFAIDKSKIIITLSADGETHTMEGEITEVTTCDWADYLQNGRTRYKVDLKDEKRGEIVKSIIEIESINGKTIITGSSESKENQKLEFIVAEYSIAAEENAAPANLPIEKEKKGKKGSRKS